MYRYIVALCSDIYTKNVFVQRGENVKFLQVKWLIVYSVDDVCVSVKCYSGNNLIIFNSPINILDKAHEATNTHVR